MPDVLTQKQRNALLDQQILGIHQVNINISRQQQEAQQKAAERDVEIQEEQTAAAKAREAKALHAINQAAEAESHRAQRTQERTLPITTAEDKIAAIRAGISITQTPAGKPHIQLRGAAAQAFQVGIPAIQQAVAKQQQLAQQQGTPQQALSLVQMPAVTTTGAPNTGNTTMVLATPAMLLNAGMLPASTPSAAAPTFPAMIELTGPNRYPPNALSNTLTPAGRSRLMNEVITEPDFLSLETRIDDTSPATVFYGRKAHFVNILALAGTLDGCPASFKQFVNVFLREPAFAAMLGQQPLQRNLTI